MKIILDKPYNFLIPGNEMDVDKGVADLLIERGVAHAKSEPPAPSCKPKTSQRGNQR